MKNSNHKICGTVSQAVYKRFKEFQKERGLSASKAINEIFIKYFEIDPTENITSEPMSEQSLPLMKPSQNLDLETEKFVPYQMLLSDSFPWMLEFFEDGAK
ncbi:hypothetical protein H6G27_29655 [Nostoc linckia FACHB-104]|nr:hypothetical protein [Nostoc linckia FACHB-104]